MLVRTMGYALLRKGLNESRTVKTAKDQTPKRLKWHGKLAARVISFAGGALASTLQTELLNPGELFKDLTTKPVIFAFWHNRLAGTPSMVKFISRQRKTPGLAALVSASSDGALLAKTLHNLGIMAVRGSSSRRGAQALLELTTWIEKGYDTAITPDGPRGPKYQVREGAIALAQLTGAPIIPLGVYFSRKKMLKSWDSFQIPFPFSKCRITVGTPIVVAEKLSETQREECRLKLQAELNRLDELTLQ